MPEVIEPQDGASTLSSSFTWTMDNIPYSSSLVIVGSTPGSDDIYSGIEIHKANGTIDHQVCHPRDGEIYYTRVKFRLTPEGAWYTTNSVITHFTSLDPSHS